MAIGAAICAVLHGNPAEADAVCASLKQMGINAKDVLPEPLLNRILEVRDRSMEVTHCRIAIADHMRAQWRTYD